MTASQPRSRLAVAAESWAKPGRDPDFDFAGLYSTEIQLEGATMRVSARSSVHMFADTNLGPEPFARWKELEMFETYRMLGRAHQDELERMAARPHSSAVAQELLFVRLLKRISSPRSTHAATTGPIKRLAPADAGNAPASAASPDH